jgi:hypothetical protein
VQIHVDMSRMADLLKDLYSVNDNREPKPDAAKTNDAFDWIPFYEELADKLVPFRSRQQELLQFLETLRADGLTITPLEDQDETGRRFPLAEIDPFTFFGSFNRGIVDETRIGILKAAKSHFVDGALKWIGTPHPPHPPHRGLGISTRDVPRSGDCGKTMNSLST